MEHIQILFASAKFLLLKILPNFFEHFELHRIVILVYQIAEALSLDVS